MNDIIPKPSTEVGELAARTAREKLLEAFESQGINEELLGAIGHDLLTATKQKVQWAKAEPPVMDEDGEVLVEGKPGRFEYSKHMTDNTTRYNTLKLIMEFYDTMPSKKIDINDTRQTKDLANAILDRMSQMGQLGADDLQPQMEVVEMELMEDMHVARMEKNEGRVSRGPVSLVPGDDDD